jgi:hypothetical protein
MTNGAAASEAGSGWQALLEPLAPGSEPSPEVLSDPGQVAGADRADAIIVRVGKSVDSLAERACRGVFAK